MIKVSGTKDNGTRGGAVGKAADSVKTAVKGGKGKMAAKTDGGAVKVSFVLPLSETPDPVSVCGDFNGWDPLMHPMKKRANGTRSVTVELPSGRFAFKYLSGGTWFTDPEAHDHESNEYGETNSILEV
ncbi:MAG: isoamylase early set domain-containing protein [Acidimicrobiales bacterium]